MNYKMKVAALALVGSGLCATSASIQAMPEADGVNGFYTSLRIGMNNTSTGDGASSTTSIDSYASRMGYKGGTDLGNGLTAFGHLEFQIDAEDSLANENGVRDTTKIRLGYVGLKGSFGNISIGQKYHTFYNFVVKPTDAPWWNGGNNKLSYSGRTGDGLTYHGKFGNFGVGLTTYIDGGSPAEGTEFGLSAKLGPVGLAFGRKDLDSYIDPIDALSVSGAVGPVNLGVLYQEQGAADSIEATIKYANFYLQTGEIGDAAATTLGYTHKLGKKTLMWFEYVTKDAGDGSDDDKAFIATFKYDVF